MLCYNATPITGNADSGNAVPSASASPEAEQIAGPVRRPISSRRPVSSPHELGPARLGPHASACARLPRRAVEEGAELVPERRQPPRPRRRLLRAPTVFSDVAPEDDESRHEELSDRSSLINPVRRSRRPPFRIANYLPRSTAMAGGVLSCRPYLAAAGVARRPPATHRARRENLARPSKPARAVRRLQAFWTGTASSQVRRPRERNLETKAIHSSRTFIRSMTISVSVRRIVGGCPWLAVRRGSAGSSLAAPAFLHPTGMPVQP